MTSNKKNFDSIPGTYVFTKEHSRKGYHLNMFCMSLNVPANREAFRDDEQGYIERFSMTPEQKEAVINRDWHLNIFFHLAHKAGILNYKFCLTTYNPLLQNPHMNS